jgi:hypothetical protein
MKYIYDTNATCGDCYDYNGVRCSLSPEEKPDDLRSIHLPDSKCCKRGARIGDLPQNNFTTLVIKQGLQHLESTLPSNHRDYLRIRYDDFISIKIAFKLLVNIINFKNY